MRVMSVKRIGFLLAHLSVVVILAGALVGYIFGEKAYVSIPVAPDHEVRELQKEDGGSIPLDFGVSCSEFVVDYYEPSHVRAVRHYGAKLHFHGPSGEEQKFELAVNHPVTYGPWRFYLMDYDHKHRRYIWLTVRRDPGRRAVLAGLWGLILGTAILCWFEMGRAPHAEAKPYGS